MPPPTAAIMDDVARSCEKLGEKLSKLIDRRGGSQSDFAASLDIPRQKLHTYLRGAIPPPDLLLKIAEQNSVTVDFLLDDAKEWPPPIKSAQSLAGVPTFELMIEVARRYVSEAAKSLATIRRADACVWENVARAMLENGIEKLGKSDRERLDIAVEFWRVAATLEQFDPSYQMYLMPHMIDYTSFQTAELSREAVYEWWNRVKDANPLIPLIASWAEYHLCKSDYESRGLVHRPAFPGEAARLEKEIRELIKDE